ncbi:MAG: hypothetical protein JW726_00080 [Anaerolineales bacterium]|nr:hypothetical protein [Anaerolineales bacterium]
MRRILSALNVIIAGVAGGLVLLGYVFPATFGNLRQTLIHWAVLLAAFALLLGIFNLFSVHWKKATFRQPGAAYSLVLIFFMFFTILLVLLDSFLLLKGPAGYWSLWVFNSFEKPVEISLLALLAVVLVFAAARLLRRRTSTFSVIFLVSALITLLLMAPVYLLKDPTAFQPIRNLISGVLAVAGARGLLLGIALGIVATALRVLIGAERPYGG